MKEESRAAFRGIVRCARCFLPHGYPALRCKGCGFAWTEGELLAWSVNEAEAGLTHVQRPLAEVDDPPQMQVSALARAVLDSADAWRRQAYWHAVRAAAEGAHAAHPKDRVQQSAWLEAWWAALPTAAGGGDAPPNWSDYALNSTNVLTWTASPNGYMSRSPSVMLNHAREGLKALLAGLTTASFVSDVRTEIERIEEGDKP